MGPDASFVIAGTAGGDLITWTAAGRQVHDLGALNAAVFANQDPRSDLVAVSRPSDDGSARWFLGKVGVTGGSLLSRVAADR